LRSGGVGRRLSVVSGNLSVSERQFPERAQFRYAVSGGRLARPAHVESGAGVSPGAPACRPLVTRRPRLDRVYRTRSGILHCMYMCRGPQKMKPLPSDRKIVLNRIKACH